MGDRPHPWDPAEYELADITAIQALERGEADAIQQKRALDWLIKSACRTYDQTYYPGEDGRRDTDFAEGRRFVGNSLVKMLRLNVGELRRRSEA